MKDIAGIISKLGLYVFLPLGVLLLAAAAYFYWDTRAWLARSVEAQGSVVEMVRVRDRETGSVRFAPLVRFQTPEGVTVEFQSGFSSNPPSYTKGEAVTVLYDPAKPHSAALSSLFSVWAFPMILSFIGAIFAAIGIAFGFVSLRLSRVAASSSASS